MGKHSEANGEMEGTRMQTCLVLVVSKLLNANNRVREIEINFKTEEMRENSILSLKLETKMSP